MKGKIMEYDVEFLIERGWWDKKGNKPVESLMWGSNARVSLPWFWVWYGKYVLTTEGKIQYKKLLANNNRRVD